MKITKAQLKKIILEELSEVSGVDTAPLGAEYTPMLPPRESAIAAAVGSIINGLRSGQLSAQGAADRLESQVKDKLYKLSLEEGEEAIEEGKCPDTHYWKSFGGQGGTCVKRKDGSKAPPSGPAGGVEQSRRYASGPKPKRWE